MEFFPEIAFKLYYDVIWFPAPKQSWELQISRLGCSLRLPVTYDCTAVYSRATVRLEMQYDISNAGNAEQIYHNANGCLYIYAARQPN